MPGLLCWNIFTVYGTGWCISYLLLNWYSLTLLIILFWEGLQKQLYIYTIDVLPWSINDVPCTSVLAESTQRAKSGGVNCLILCVSFRTTFLLAKSFTRRKGVVKFQLERKRRNISAQAQRGEEFSRGAPRSQEKVLRIKHHSVGHKIWNRKHYCLEFQLG